MALTEETKVSKPATTPKVVAKDHNAEQIQKLTELVGGLTAQLDAIKNAPRPGTTVRKRTKEHECTLREFANAEGEVLGIVTRIWDIKEIKDKEENKRYICTSKMDIFDPRTKKEMTLKEVDYIHFLNNAKKVRAKVTKWDKETRFEVDRKRGGGGVGPLTKQTDTRDYITETNFEFEVGYTDHKFTLLIDEGEFEGLEIETDEKAINI